MSLPVVVSTICTASQTSISITDPNDLKGDILTISKLNEASDSHQSALPREFRNRIHKLFERVEREYEREYQKLCAENYSLQEKLEKLEEAEHPEPSNFAKKMTASQLSQRIKQQYKQSTLKLVSSLRPSSGGLSLPNNLPTPNPGSVNFISNDQNTVASSSNLRNAVSTFATSSGSTGSWKPANIFLGHRDGIWEVTCFNNFVATASADSTVRIWNNQEHIHNSTLIYLGHSGSVNSVRFYPSKRYMLTGSGDGTAHLVRLPQTFFDQSSTSLFCDEDSTANTVADSVLKDDSTDLNKGLQNGSETNFEAQLTSPSSTACMILRNPDLIFQSATLSFGDGQTMSGQESTLDSSPLAAADFLSDCNQIVTASWDRLGRLYDINTGQEVQSLTGHDQQLTDVRCAESGMPVVVTSSRDGTFRLWDFRSNNAEFHVQQAHNRTVSTAQFLPGCSPDRLVTAGSDHICRLWDLRNCRSPIFTVRTDAGINRFAISKACAFVDSKYQSLNLALQTPVERESGSASKEACCQPSTFTQSAVSFLDNSYVLALPMDNRTVRFIDINGSRIGRIPRNTNQGHKRVITSAAWAEDGFCNFFTAAFDHRLLGWQLQIP